MYLILNNIKQLSIEIKLCLLTGQIDKFRRRPKYDLPNLLETKFENIRYDWQNNKNPPSVINILI